MLFGVGLTISSRKMCPMLSKLFKKKLHRLRNLRRLSTEYKNRGKWSIRTKCKGRSINISISGGIKTFALMLRGRRRFLWERIVFRMTGKLFKIWIIYLYLCLCWNRYAKTAAITVRYCFTMKKPTNTVNFSRKVLTAKTVLLKQ